MTETALAISPSQENISLAISNLSPKQLKFLSAEMRRNRTAALAGKSMDHLFSILKNPLVLLILAFVAIDFGEAHNWPGEPGNTIIGPAAGIALRGVVVSTELMNAIGNTGIADAVATMTKSGAEAAGSLAPMLAMLKGIPA